MNNNNNKNNKNKKTHTNNQFSNQKNGPEMKNENNQGNR